MNPGSVVELIWLEVVDNVPDGGAMELPHIELVKLPGVD
jgi:hypothetical protein